MAAGATADGSSLDFNVVVVATGAAATAGCTGTAADGAGVLFDEDADDTAGVLNSTGSVYKSKCQILTENSTTTADAP